MTVTLLRGKRRLLVAGSAALIAAIVALALGLQPTEAEYRLSFDIAEYGGNFVFDETPVHEDDGLPAYGGEFVTQGYIYPGGVLDKAEHGGVMPDGSPEFPDLVVGTWTCSGWHIGDGAHTVTGPWVVSTQLYDLGPTPGAESITTYGYELPDVGVPIDRTIIGGTGRYTSGAGLQTQRFLGFNDTFGVMIRVEFQVER